VFPHSTIDFAVKDLYNKLKSGKNKNMQQVFSVLTASCQSMLAFEALEVKIRNDI